MHGGGVVPVVVGATVVGDTVDTVVVVFDTQLLVVLSKTYPVVQNPGSHCPGFLLQKVQLLPQASHVYGVVALFR